ncbi:MULTISPECIES: DUF2442 domain-containing protein [Sanguibacteroides]|uniref:HTH cro/C1-type domain-containing protein n=1 Tax=Sanguibacteroides justesenii TaxID=1547597 RepID=A0AB34R8X3_9PORP|nr:MULTISPECIES: DUF2442 domain-containing protein [Sanguibacteroides]KIO45468.1 hypothetical protein IE90_08670 [Sanguibacteroides justesenii]PXZ44752.1 DUF2442 domain-containing protein [Sanguibacteroides justesenii]
MEIKKLWFKDEYIWIRNESGEDLKQSLKWYPRLVNATAEQRANYKLSAMGIHWPELDEDISFESFLFDVPVEEPVNRLGRVFKSIPELNISKIARRIGISQSILSAYINGIKKPSKEREEKIIKALHDLGEELKAV